MNVIFGRDEYQFLKLDGFFQKIQKTVLQKTSLCSLPLANHVHEFYASQGQGAMAGRLLCQCYLMMPLVWLCSGLNLILASIQVRMLTHRFGFPQSLHKFPEILICFP